MLKIHEHETIFTSYAVMNIKYFIGMIFVSNYFGPRITNRPQETHNYGPGKSKFEIYSSPKFGFGCYHNILFCVYFKHIHKKEGVVFSYINKVKYIPEIVFPTTCGYHDCGEKTGLMLDICFLNITLH